MYQACARTALAAHAALLHGRPRFGFTMQRERAQ
jgi:hypothetical protein